MIKHLIALTTGEWIAIVAIVVPIFVAAIFANTFGNGIYEKQMIYTQTD